jgi:peptidoglycan hydrolase CwlO-like protein
MSETRETWHLDKRFPLALILTIVMQTLTVVWWAAGISARIEQHEREIRALTNIDTQMQGEVRRIAELLSRLDERMTAQTELLRRVEANIQRPTR